MEIILDTIPNLMERQRIEASYNQKLKELKDLEQKLEVAQAIEKANDELEYYANSDLETVDDCLLELIEEINNYYPFIKQVEVFEDDKKIHSFAKTNNAKVEEIIKKNNNLIVDTNALDWGEEIFKISLCSAEYYINNKVYEPSCYPFNEALKNGWKPKIEEIIK